jgi:signal transduction histidine kinase
VVYTALDNVRVHSRSTEVVVEINHTNDQIEVHIADDGIGLSSVMPAYEANHALTRAREYMRYLGGDLMISEGCPQGVTVDAWWPHQSQASGGR